jgi:predicted nucleic acid-binding protein
LSEIVVDASLVGTFLLPDETPIDGKALFANSRLIAPGLLRLEVANMILRACRRGRIDPSAIDRSLRTFDAIPMVLVDDIQRRNMMELALRHGLTAYDATYLALAVERAASLATFDKALARAAQDERVPLAVSA